MDVLGQELRLRADGGESAKIVRVVPRELVGSRITRDRGNVSVLVAWACLY